MEQQESEGVAVVSVFDIRKPQAQGNSGIVHVRLLLSGFRQRFSARVLGDGVELKVMRGRESVVTKWIIIISVVSLQLPARIQKSSCGVGL